MAIKIPQPTIIDLFSGVGGISLGAARAGYRVVAAVDNDARVLAAHARNFPNTQHIHLDVAGATGKALLDLSGLSSVAGIVGGPPCQGFSTIGSRRANDKRNTLFNHFFRLVSEIRPQFFLAENVTGILEPKYASIVDVALEQVELHYHVIRGIQVTASNFGAPTTRKRILFIGFRKTDSNPLDANAFLQIARPYVYVKEALLGLPSIRAEWQSEAQGWRKIQKHPSTSFGRKVSEEVPPGLGCAEALHRLRSKGEISGCLGTQHTTAVLRRFEKLRYGETDAVSRAVRLDPNGFCPTLRAGTNREFGSFQSVRPIHPNSPRVITPREAARLQGFPDWFVFDSTKWHSFRMIGNSVSPILAEEVLLTIRKHLNQQF